VADLELGNLSVLEYVLQLVGGQRPDAVGVFHRVLRYDLSVELVEFDEVRVAQKEVLEELNSLYAFAVK